MDARSRRSPSAHLGQRRRRVGRLLKAACALGFALALAGAERQAHAQQIFATNLPIATGIATDLSGNVYVDSDAVWTTYITRFSPFGTIIGRTQLGGITVGNLGRIARVPNSNQMLLVTTGGMIYAFGPNLALSPVVNLGLLNFAVANNAYDVNTGVFGAFTLGAPTWGDIAAHWQRSDLLYVYVTATTGAAGGFPFVLRLDFDFTRNRIFWRVVARSSTTTAGTVNQPRGLAVNTAGWVLTGFPFRTPVGFADTLSAFRTTFPEVRSTLTVPRYVLRTTRTASGLFDVASFGMTSDAAGNFYVASGVVGSSLCGFGGSSALVVINRDPNIPNPRCFNLPAILTSSNDVTVSPVGNIPYMTAGSLVVRFNPLASASAAASASTEAEALPAPTNGKSLPSLAGLRGAKLVAR